jgi:hypothetical protein
MTRHDRPLRLPIRLRSPAELAQLRASGALQGLAVHVLVLHDEQCTPSRCICSPEYELREVTVETLLEGARLQAAWVRSTAS